MHLLITTRSFTLTCLFPIRPTNAPLTLPPAIFEWELFDEHREVPQVPDSEPWKESGGRGEYKFYPGNDPSRGIKETPSALNSVIIKDVNLPRV